MDPIGFASGINLYLYVQNGSIIGADNYGLNTIFLGGAGYESETAQYAKEIVDKMKQTGIPLPEYVPVGTDLGQLGNIMFSILNMNEMNLYSISTWIVTDEPCSKSNGGGGSRNFVGYSYGSIVAAQAALRLAADGITTDNLILLGSPISSDSKLFDDLVSNGLIKNIVRIDIANDPLSNGIHPTRGKLKNHFLYINNDNGKQDRLVHAIDVIIILNNMRD